MKSVALVAVIFLPAFTAPADNDQSTKQARVREMNIRHMPFVLRIGNKFPAAEFGQPVHHEESK